MRRPSLWKPGTPVLGGSRDKSNQRYDFYRNPYSRLCNSAGRRRHPRAGSPGARALCLGASAAGAAQRQEGVSFEWRADSGLFPHPFSGDPDRPYNEFYAALKTWNRYDLVGDPADADLVFELQLTAPYGPSNPNKPNGAADPLPMFRLVILDRKTHYVLWTLTESVDVAYLQKTHNHNFDQALSNLLLDLKRLTAATAAGNH